MNIPNVIKLIVFEIFSLLCCTYVNNICTIITYTVEYWIFREIYVINLLSTGGIEMNILHFLAIDTVIS